ncbi:MAG TPA: sodium:proton antiporter [Candidatus Methylomirabilis sp.]|nr:sodium:proton antiporter [Candidatus Methylomirabilis sp.]
MRLFDLIAVFIVMAAGFGYLNFRLLKLPTTIGLMALSLLFSLSLFVLGAFVPAVAQQTRSVIEQFDFNQVLLHGMLAFLLFAGALHIDLGDLARHKEPIVLLATVGVLLSTLIVGVLMWGVFALLGFKLRFIDCLLFGALISPTDPIAVLSLLKKIGAPKTLEVQIAGESLFNDGIGVVLFMGLLEVATGENDFDVGHFAFLFIREAVGGAVFGLAIGLVAYRMLKSVDNYQVEILLSLALVWGGSALADALHMSAPIAMVVAGLLIGNQGRSFAMSKMTTEHLDLFWELVDEGLNAVLFVAIGMELLVLTFTASYLAAGVLAVVIVLVARLVSVGLPVWLLRRSERFDPSMVPILVWGGLRGGISVALALSLPPEVAGDSVPRREVILATTYVVVVFSILVQGLTVGTMTRRWLGRSPKPIEALKVVPLLVMVAAWGTSILTRTLAS